MGFEHGRCESCRHWESVGLQCGHPKVGTSKKRLAGEKDCLVTVPANVARIRTGAKFGCVHWELADELREESGAQTVLSGPELRALLVEKGLKPSDLAGRLGVKRQRVSDWLTGRRDVPATAVAALKAMGLFHAVSGRKKPAPSSAS